MPGAPGAKLAAAPPGDSTRYSEAARATTSLRDMRPS